MNVLSISRLPHESAIYLLIFKLFNYTELNINRTLTGFLQPAKKRIERADDEMKGWSSNSAVFHFIDNRLKSIFRTENIQNSDGLAYSGILMLGLIFYQDSFL